MIVMLPTYFIEQQPKNNQLQIVLPDWQMLTYQVYAVYPSRRQLPKTVRSFVDFLVEEFEGKGIGRGKRKCGRFARFCRKSTACFFMKFIYSF